MRVASLHVYPVKALAGTEVDEAEVELKGFSGDRRLMVVEPDGTFLTQREVPRLAALRPVRGPDGLVIELPEGGAISVPEPDGRRAAVSVWGAEVDAVRLGDAVDAALSDWLGRPVLLVAMDGHSKRTAHPDWAPDAPVSFADGYPMLIASTASLDALNERIRAGGGVPVPMARFRTNIVVTGGPAWAEDGWAAVRIGAVTFALPKPCKRCVVTTTDQTDGTQSDDEPLRTLTTFRRSRDRRIAGVLFALNAVPDRPGTIRRGDAVEVVAVREPWPVG